MGSKRLAAAVLTAALLAAPASAQGDAPDGDRAAKTAVEKAARGLSGDEAASLKEKILLNCKKTGTCKPNLLKKKPKKPPPGGGLSAGAADDAGFTGEEDGPEAAPDAALAPAAGEQAEAVRQAAVGRRERAFERAAGAADALRQGLLETEDEPAPGRRGPGGGRPPSGGGDAPQSVSELALAERSGYAAAFRSQGLKVGAGPLGEAAIQRLDGTPASEPELARLRTVLRAEPEALRRRPDFFAVLTRGQFSELKRDFAGRPELRRTDFKHIAMTKGARDFQWSASCGPLSGDCNPHVREEAYRKGQDVSPEDLKEVWEALAEEADEDDAEWEEYTEEDRRLAEAEDLAAAKLAGGTARVPALSALLARLGGLARGTAESLGLVSDRHVPEPGSDAPLAAARGQDGRSDDRGAREYAGEGTASGSPVRRPGAPPAPGGRGKAGRRTGLYILAAAAAAGFIALGLRK